MDKGRESRRDDSITPGGPNGAGRCRPGDRGGQSSGLNVSTDCEGNLRVAANLLPRVCKPSEAVCISPEAQDDVWNPHATIIRPLPGGGASCCDNHPSNCSARNGAVHRQSGCLAHRLRSEGTAIRISDRSSANLSASDTRDPWVSRGHRSGAGDVKKDSSRPRAEKREAGCCESTCQEQQGPAQNKVDRRRLANPRHSRSAPPRAKRHSVLRDKKRNNRSPQCAEEQACQPPTSNCEKNKRRYGSTECPGPCSQEEAGPCQEQAGEEGKEVQPAVRSLGCEEEPRPSVRKAPPRPVRKRLKDNAWGGSPHGAAGVSGGTLPTTVRGGAATRKS